ncbi:hypothetical protein PoB_003141600 [Plakobranchus ocellatus]|uniref:Uncharacterized protein n=1 Tax=Plakobranchus ocellatus TaxID=259542 RepID=A0AAV4A9E5_9GAST|nr:hypothetical protein PoB_003141600 [Plakobranchus ocellatus]
MAGGKRFYKKVTQSTMTSRFRPAVYVQRYHTKPSTTSAASLGYKKKHTAQFTWSISADDFDPAMIFWFVGQDCDHFEPAEFALLP